MQVVLCVLGMRMRVGKSLLVAVRERVCVRVGVSVGRRVGVSGVGVSRVVDVSGMCTWHSGGRGLSRGRRVWVVVCG